MSRYILIGALNPKISGMFCRMLVSCLLLHFFPSTIMDIMGWLAKNYWNPISIFAGQNPCSLAESMFNDTSGGKNMFSMLCVELVLRQFKGHPVLFGMVRFQREVRGSHAGGSHAGGSHAGTETRCSTRWPTQLEERIIQLKDDEILDNTVIFGIATISTVLFIYIYIGCIIQ